MKFSDVPNYFRVKTSNFCLICELSPIVDEKKGKRETNDCWSITEDCLNPKNFLVQYADFDVEVKYMAISLNYREGITWKAANETLQKVKKENKVAFVEWMPTVCI